MRQLSSTRNFVAIIVMALLLVIATPATSFAKDKHGKGRNRDDSDWSRRNRKCGKFVNCHDARDGRWDGRGPRGQRVGNVVWRNRLRNRNVDNNRFWRLRRARLHNRN